MGMSPRLMRPRASGGFSPKNISNLAAWYDAQVASSITIATGVSQWNDLSGLGRHVTQATTGNQPIYTTDATLGGKSVVRFDGSNDRLTATFTHSKPTTVFLVGKFDTVVGGGNKTMYDGNTTGNTLRHLWPTTTTLSINGGAELGSLQMPANSQAVYYVHEAIYDGTNSLISYNNQYTNTGNAGTAAVSGIAFGGFGGFAAFGDCSIAEFFMYSRSLTATERKSCRAYLAKKYGITVA
jgi:hypothetical protein